MPRWLKILIGPLPASVILIPLLLAGGAGTLFAILGQLLEPIQAPGEPWRTIGQLGLILLWVAGATVGVVALWGAILTDSPAALRRPARRWWLAVGLLTGLISATRWVVVMAGQGSHGVTTWLVWLALLLGPLILSLFYLARLLRP